MHIIFPWNPLESLDEYLKCDEWHLYHTVLGWPREKSRKKMRLGQEWARLYQERSKMENVIFDGDID